MHMNVLSFGRKTYLFMLPTGATAKKYRDNKTDEWLDEQFSI